MNLSRTKTFVSVIVVLTVAVSIAVGLYLVRPKPKVAVLEQKTLLINAVKAIKQNLKISVQAQGTVIPRTSTTLVSEVSGMIINVSPKFKVGGYFKQGEILLQIDQRNYKTQLKRTEAAVASAKSKLASEKGLAEVAYQDWIKYKSNVKRSAAATDLALRKPQLTDAQARLDSSIADLEHARDELARTTIRAPYDCLVQSKQVDIGQYVNTGAVLAKTFAIDVAEVRLALPENKLNYLNLPTLTNTENSIKPVVDLYANIGGQEHHWKAYIVRTEGVFDQRSRVLFAVAQVKDPYGLNITQSQPLTQPLRIGTFVDATIEGKLIHDVIKLPRHILRTGNRIWVIDSQQRLHNRQIETLQTQGNTIYVTAGLENAEHVSLSNISGTLSGTKVRIASLTTTDQDIHIKPPPERQMSTDNSLKLSSKNSSNSKSEGSTQ